MKSKINETGQIEIFQKLPSSFKNILNFQMADDALLQSCGFFDVVEPVFNPETHKLGTLFFDEFNQFFTYQVINLTQKEIDYNLSIKNWHHPEFNKRIIVPISDIISNQSIKEIMSLFILWWTLQKLPHESTSSLSYFYCNFIHENHLPLLSQYDFLTVELIPTL